MSNPRATTRELEKRLYELEKRILVLESKIDELEKHIALILNSNEDMKLILEYVVLPLLIIVAGLVGIKLVFPTH